MKLLKCALIVAALFAILMAACKENASVTNTANAPAKPASTANSIANAATPAAASDDGKDLYVAKCMICHKDTGKGGKVTVEGKDLKPADLTSDKMKARPDDKMFKGISEGSPDDGMPAFEDKLSEAQIKAIIKYIHTLQAS
jgi:mono/diheme cytochrome c family protein